MSDRTLASLLRVCQAAFLLSVLMFPSEQMVMATELSPAPTLSQKDDEVRVKNQQFDKQCRIHFQGIAERQEWQIRTVVITRSPQWGLIWRADFDVAGIKNRTRMLNRLVCWEATGRNGLSSNIAFGQHIKPLT